MTNARSRGLGVITALGFSLAAAGCADKPQEGVSCHPDGDAHLIAVNDITGEQDVLDARYSVELNEDETVCQSKDPMSGLRPLRYNPRAVSVTYEKLQEAIEKFGYDPVPEAEPGV